MVRWTLFNVIARSETTKQSIFLQCSEIAEAAPLPAKSGERVKSRYSDACFLNPATSCAVRCDGWLPKRAVT
jgi:hypothetical protein